ncbi:MAG: hypothetical protein HY053_09130, partial [Proteobacteria bacterium]|nr:hypothetical protein [Pseudomonadota bacterium]
VRRNILIVEDSSRVLQEITGRLSRTGFTSKTPIRSFDPRSPEPFILRRGHDQIHITSFKPAAAQAVQETSYALAFFDFLVHGEKGTAFMGDVIIHMLKKQPLCPVYLINGGSPENQIKSMKTEARRIGADVDIDRLVEEKRLRPFFKSADRICEVIEAALRMPQAVAEPQDPPQIK